MGKVGVGHGTLVDGSGLDEGGQLSLCVDRDAVGIARAGQLGRVASAGDAWDLIQPIDKGDGTRRAMEMAMERHGVPRDEIDLINPHGTSTPLGDLREAEAIRAVFGERTGEVAISGTKSMTGHLMGAAGAVEGVFTVLSVHHQIAPATLNFEEPDPEIGLDVVHGASREMPIRYAMSDNIGLGGHNGAVIFKRYDGD